MTDTYIGSKKIKDVNEVEKIDLVSVLFEDDSTMDFTREQFASVKSDA